MASPSARRTSSRTPWATLLLIVANLAVAFSLYVVPNVVERLGFHADEPRLVGVIAGLFVHANLAHLLGNMVFLAAVGAAVELATGPWRFLTVYSLSGLAGVLVYWLTARRLPDPAVLAGASGCVAGCAGYYSLRYPSLRVLVGPHRALSVAWVTAIWALLQVLGIVLSLGAPVSGRAFFAHLGGLVMGLVLGVLFRAPDLGGRTLGHRMLEQVNERGPDAVIAAAKTHLEEHPEDPVALARLAGALGDLGDRDGEAGARLRLMNATEGEPRREALARLLALDAGRLPARRRLQLAEEVAPEDRALAARLLDGILEDAGAGPDALLARAVLTEPADARFLERLAREYPLHPATELARRRGLL